MRSAACGHSIGTGNGPNGQSSPAGPYTLTICGFSLNQPHAWQDLIFDFGP